MGTIRRYLAALYPSRPIPQYLKECRYVVTKMTGNVYVTNPDPPLTTVTSHLDTLETTDQATHHGVKGAAATRDVALLVVRGDMRHLTSSVQLVADANITHAQEIIESCGFFVTSRNGTGKPDLAVRYGGAPGRVDLAGTAIKGQGSYQWQISDQKTWTDLPPTSKASTTVTGLTPVTLYSFRYRTISAAGLSDWSTPVSIIAR